LPASTVSDARLTTWLRYWFRFAFLLIVPGDGELTSILKEELEYESQDAKEKKTFEAFQETRSSIEALGFKVRS
jgi:hypothetical protein